MNFSTSTAGLGVLTNALLMALSIAYCVGVRHTNGLRSWTWSLLFQALGFVCFVASQSWNPHALTTLGILCFSLSLSYVQLTTRRLLGGHISHPMFFSPPVALALLNAIFFNSLPMAVGLTNLGLGWQGLWLAWVLLKAANHVRWRLLMGSTVLLNAITLFARSGQAFLGEGPLPVFDNPSLLNIASLMLLNATMVLGTVCFLLAHRDAAEQALNRLASYDSLTGLLNRRVWLEQAETWMAMPSRNPNDVVVLLDLDHFKTVNDTYGHAVGDQVLVLFGAIIRNTLRRGDLAGRYGGEEFCLLLVDCAPEAFAALDAKLHAQMESRSKAELGFEVSFSAGAVVRQGATALPELLRQADALLYRAKAAGRKQTVCS